MLRPSLRKVVLLEGSEIETARSELMPNMVGVYSVTAKLPLLIATKPSARTVISINGVESAPVVLSIAGNQQLSIIATGLDAAELAVPSGTIRSPTRRSPVW